MHTHRQGDCSLLVPQTRLDEQTPQTSTFVCQLIASSWKTFPISFSPSASFHLPFCMFFISFNLKPSHCFISATLTVYLKLC